MKALFYFFVALSSIQGFAQAKLGMHPFYTISPASAITTTAGVSYGTAITIKCFVQNKGNAPYSGGIALMRSVKSGSLQTSPAVVYTLSVTNMLPGDTINTTFMDSIKPANYKQNGNGNTVVVWPVSSVMTADSLYTTPVYVSIATGIEILDKHPLFMYPNPVSQQVFIRPENGRNYKKVIVYDLDMKPLLELPFAESLDLGALAAGTYILSVLTEQGQAYSSKLIKTN